MTARAEYTEDEWRLLKIAPYTAGMAVVFSDGSGVLETLRESVALVVSHVGGLQRYPDNELIKALASDRMTGTAQDTARAETEGVDPSQVAAHLRAAALDDCRRIAVLLAERSSAAERDGYLR